MSLDNQTHFDHIANSYQKASDTWEPIYRQIETYVSTAIQNKAVLDIGNGGYFPYDTEAASKVTVLDISPKMLDRISKPNITKVVGNAMDLKGIEDESQDIILYILCLHHIQGESYKKSLDVLEQVLSAAHKKLKPGGELIIAEPTTKGFYFHSQKLLFRLTQFILNLKQVPMIFFHHPNILRTKLANSFGCNESRVSFKELKVEGWVDPLGGSFPGLIKIPAATCPTNYHLITITKQQ